MLGYFYFLDRMKSDKSLRMKSSQNDNPSLSDREVLYSGCQT